MEWLQDAEDFSSSPGSLAGDESGSEIDELPLHHRHHNETPTPSFDSPEVLASYVGSPIREHHGQGLAFFDAADCPQTDDDFIDDEDSDPEDGDDSDTPTDAQSSAIAEIFRCFICLGKVVEAQLCPCCSKICCLRCIKRWLMDQRPQCPHCRASLRVSQLVNCRFIADLSTELEKLQKNILGEVQEKTCSLHNSPMSYYCNTCSDAVCSDCAVFGEEHRGHSFERLSAVYERHVETIRSEAVGLRRRLKDLCALVSEKDKNIERVHKAKDEAGMELQLAFEGMQARLEQQLKSKLLTLLAQKGSMTQEIEGLDAMMHDLNVQLNTVPESELIGRSTGICGMLQEVHQRPTSDLNRTPVPSDFISEVVPPYDQGEFVLHDFERVLRRTSAVGTPNPSPRGVTSVRTVEPMQGSNAVVPSEDTSDGAGVVYSQLIHAAGIVWRLKVYPNGNGVAAGSYLSVFLEMVQGGSEPAKYEYKIEMFHRTRPNQSVIREFASVFEVGECWGYNRFFRLEVLKEEGYLLPDEDTITLRFHVRAPTYAQQCQDLRRALVTLDGEKSDALKQVDVLRRAFADTLWWKRRRKMPANRDETGGGSGAQNGDKLGVSGQEECGPAALEHDVSKAYLGNRNDVINEGRRSEGEREPEFRRWDAVQKGAHRGRSSGVKKKGRGSGKRVRDALEGGVSEGSIHRKQESGKEPQAVALPVYEEDGKKGPERSQVESDDEYVEALEPTSEGAWVQEPPESSEMRPPIVESIVQGEPLQPPRNELVASHACSEQEEGVPTEGGAGVSEAGRREDGVRTSLDSDEEFIAALERSSNGTWSRDMVMDSAGPGWRSHKQAKRGSRARGAANVSTAEEERLSDGQLISPLGGGPEATAKEEAPSLQALPEQVRESSGGLPVEIQRSQPVVGPVLIHHASEARTTEESGGQRKRGMTVPSNESTAFVVALTGGVEGGRSAKPDLAENMGFVTAPGVDTSQVAPEPQPSDLRQEGSRNAGEPVSRSGKEETENGEVVSVERGGFDQGTRASNGHLGDGPRSPASIGTAGTECTVAEPATSAPASSLGEVGCSFADGETDPPDASRKDPDGGKENVRSSDQSQAKLPARSPCAGQGFMERVAKVSSVEGGCALSRPALVTAPKVGLGLGVKALGAELKSRLRSEARFFVRGRDRKGSMDDLRVSLQSEESRGKKLSAGKGKEEDGGSAGSGVDRDQFWHNNPFVRVGRGEQEGPAEAEAAPTAEADHRRNWEALLNRALSSTDARKAEVSGSALEGDEGRGNSEGLEARDEVVTKAEEEKEDSIPAVSTT